MALVRRIPPGTGNLLERLKHRDVPALLPGGMSVVFAGDVGAAHVMAEEYFAEGSIQAGERYILSESYHTAYSQRTTAFSAMAGTTKRLKSHTGTVGFRYTPLREGVQALIKEMELPELLTIAAPMKPEICR